jgi:hypothetical protein
MRSPRPPSGDSLSVTTEEWDRCWRLFGPWVTGEQERARTIVNRELDAPGLDLMRGFDVVGQLARVDCPTLVCVGELDPMTPVAAAREIVDALPSGGAAGGGRGGRPLPLEGRPGSLLAAGRRVRDGSPVIRPAPGTPQAWVRVLRTLAISRSASRLASAWRLS